MLPRLRFAAFVRCVLLALPLALAACGGEEATPPVNYPPLRYDYLPKLRLNVARIAIDDSWAPRGEARHVEFLAPEQPRDALRQMAQDRLFPAGAHGVASFVIEDASIVRGPGQLDGSLRVRLDIIDDSGTLLGSAEARVRQVRPLDDDSPAVMRDVLYRFVRSMMEEMNVNFEFELRKALKTTLQTTSPTGPEATPVQSEPLGAPGSEPPAPTATPEPAAPTAPDVPASMTPPTTIEPPAAPTPAPAPAAPGTRMPTTLMPLGPTQAPLPNGPTTDE
jgi:hypothetical protein